MRYNKYEYDAFISHAVEDKIPIANELCSKLEAAGLKIWYSGKELGVGDSIDKTIQNGLHRSRFGIVILSPTYLAKNWTIREFYTLLAKEIEEHKVILPVLYNITLDELKNKDLLMADRFAVNADRGLDFVVGRLVKEIKKSNFSTTSRRPWLSKIRFLLTLSLLANIALLSKTGVFSTASSQLPQPEFQPVQQSTIISAEKVLDGLQGLIHQMDRCACQRHGPGTNAEAPRSGQNHYAAQHAGGRANPKKMTMAVIFQMETAGDTPPAFNSEEGEPLRPINMPSENDPFVGVKSADIFTAQADCFHTARLAE